MTQCRQVPARLRWLLALLTLCASLLHLTRSPSAGGLGWAPGRPAAQAHAAAKSECGPHSLQGRDSRPSPPHSGHAADAHCPFCFTAAFALEAAAYVLPFSGAADRFRPVQPRFNADARRVRHADARAPPPGPDLRHPPTVTIL